MKVHVFCRQVSNCSITKQHTRMWAETFSDNFSVVVTKALLLPFYWEGYAHLFLWMPESAVYCGVIKRFVQRHVSHQATGEHAASCSRHLVSPAGGGRTRLSWPGPPNLISQVGRSSPQPWIQTHLNPLSRPRQPIGACLATCPGL